MLNDIQYNVHPSLKGKKYPGNPASPATEMFSQSVAQPADDHPLTKFGREWKSFLQELMAAKIEIERTAPSMEEAGKQIRAVQQRWLASRNGTFYDDIPKMLKQYQDAVRNSPAHNFTDHQLRNAELEIQTAPKDAIAAENWYNQASDAARFLYKQAGLHNQLIVGSSPDDTRTQAAARLKRYVSTAVFHPAKRDAIQQLEEFSSRVEGLYKIMQNGDAEFATGGILESTPQLTRPNPMSWKDAQFQDGEWKFSTGESAGLLE